MEQFLIVGALLVIGFNLGLLFVRLFGLPEDDDPRVAAPLRAPGGNPSRR